MKTFFDSTFVNGRKFGNRFLVAPMTRISANPDGIPGSEMLNYYTAFAEGGFAGIITEGIYTDILYSKAYHNQPGLTNHEQMLGWQKITRSVHQHPSIFIAQLMHAGAISQFYDKTKAPSGVIPKGEKIADYGGGRGTFPIPEELTRRDVENVIEGFASSAEMAYNAGFDGIELHAANGYLLDQFITPYLNLRTDKYGGNIENRLRIIFETLITIKKRVPEGFILGLRISEGKVNNLSYRWEKGAEMAREILNHIRDWGISYLHVAAEHFGWERNANTKMVAVLLVWPGKY